MAFKVFNNSGNGGGLPRGMMTVCLPGRARFHLEDLADQDIAGRVTVLVDREKKRLGFRRPESHEEPFAVRQDKGCGLIWIGGALLELGLTVEQAKGTRECVFEKGSLIVVDFNLPAE